jgi:hypothetical protein
MIGIDLMGPALARRIVRTCCRPVPYPSSSFSQQSLETNHHHHHHHHQSLQKEQKTTMTLPSFPTRLPTQQPTVPLPLKRKLSYAI